MTKIGPRVIGRKPRKCIYCARSCKPSKEHPLPRNLGNFRNDCYLYAICDSCNNTLSTCDQFLVLCSPEAALRFERGIVGRRRRRPISPFQHGASGSPPVRFLVKFPYGYRLVEPVVGKPGEVVELDQFVIRERQTEKDFHLLFTAGMTSEELRRRLKELRIKGRMDVSLVCPPSRRREGVRLLKTLGPGCPIDEVPVTGPVCAQGGTQTFRVKTEYFRAIAKIGFHYFLARTRFYSGLEAFFSPIKDFIRHGTGQTADFVIQRRPPIFQEMLGMGCPSSTLHFLAATQSASRLFANVILFWGPTNPGIPYEINLCEGRPTIAPPSLVRFSHVYVYFPSKQGNYDGEVKPNIVVRAP